MSAIPNPQPTRPPLPFLDDVAAFLVGASLVGAGVTLVVLALWATGVLRRVGLSSQQSVMVAGGLTVATVVVGVLGVLLRG